MVPRTALVICLCLTLAPSVAESGSLAQAPPRVVPRKGPETALVDSLVGFPLDGTLSVLDHPVALYLIGSLFGWPEGATGPEFTPQQDMVLTEVGGVLSSCFEHDASGRPTCVNPEPLLVEVRQATAFGCSYAYSGKCPDRSPAGLLGVFPMTFRGELLAFAYERARMNVPLEGGETYYALFRRQAGASPGGLLIWAGNPVGGYAYFGGNVVLGGVTPSESSSGWSQAGVRVLAKRPVRLW